MLRLIFFPMLRTQNGSADLIWTWRSVVFLSARSAHLEPAESTLPAWKKSILYTGSGYSHDIRSIKVGAELHTSLDSQ